jgi:hypothetical protein
MALLGIELSDSGIMAAAGDPPRLLTIDGTEQSSPGFALQLNQQLLMGWDAVNRFRFNPRSYTNRFWDELGTEPIKQPGLEGKTCAELAYRHLLKLRDNLTHAGDEAVIAVPGFYTPHQLGILLGIAHEVSIPVKGFIPIALAGSQAPHPRHPLLHLDIHLHRIEITLLVQNSHLVQQEVKTIADRGFTYLYTEWVRMVADEFVRTTRFDPFDTAEYEQALYNRLPRAIAGLQPNASSTFALQAGAQSFRVPLSYDLFAQKTETVFSEVRRIITDMVSGAGTPEKAPVLQITHRVSHLPGCREALHKIPSLILLELTPGAGALGALRLRDRFAGERASRGVALISSRPWPVEAAGEHIPASPGHGGTQPTHILHGGYAYPITSTPLIIGQDGREAAAPLRISRNPAEVLQRCCTIKREGNEVVLVNEWSAGTLVNDRVILEASVLMSGQTVRVGAQTDELKMIVCVDADEKENRNRI